MKNFSTILSIFSLLIAFTADASKIQQQGIVTAADCTARGIANSVCLPTDSQVYVGANSINQTLNAALTSGALLNSIKYLAPYVQVFTSGNGTYNPTYAFFVTSANATAGATYTNNSVTFTVGQTISSGTILYAQGSSAPAASGTLTKASGTGDATITFTAFRAPLYDEVDTLGSGGGGGGSGTSGGGGGNGNLSCLSTTGTTTCTGTTFVTCPGGLGGSGSGGGGGGTGGACTITTSSTLFTKVSVAGGNGYTAANINSGLTFQEGGGGGVGPFGGGSGLNSAPAANSGGGGAGGSAAGSGIALGAGGAAGSYAKVVIINPTSLHYVSGAAGSAGGAGTGGTGGSAAAAGINIFQEYYQ